MVSKDVSVDAYIPEGSSEDAQTCGKTVTLHSAMKDLPFEILPVNLLDEYLQKVPAVLSQNFDQLKDSTLSTGTFSFYTSVSAVFSSKIEGENIELDSFMKHKMLGAHFLPDYTQKIDDLYETYQFAQNEKLSYKAVQEAHQLLTKHILQKERRGQLRMGNMFVITPDGKIEYVACSPDLVAHKMELLFNDIGLLSKAKLTASEVFFCASMIHLAFVKIHPFEDGNGRTARLLEKWFIAEKLGPKAWFMQSEKLYYDQHQTYYHNIRLLGLEYELLDYSKALPFLLMLAQSLK
ncbi:Fic family protein [Mucilaginibacter sp. CAU 1740]|uniref:Fic family protein n=1 Tax=Mucilaginibacter sp. CAU 1740 TaxID=3140365 RepID=UPI00325A6FF2